VEETVSALWEIHSYSVPCFVVLPIQGGSPDYLAWVREQTEKPVTV